MVDIQLSRLSQVPLREVWKHEAAHFTQWLAIPENLELLGQELDLELVNVQTEVGVGQFFVDILAEDQGGETPRTVIIENQLEPTNHDHLGKLITYAAGMQAQVVVWIVERARQEHEQAVNWLNEHTDESANFFLVQIEAWRIEKSLPAPRFNIIARPNEWVKTIRKSSTTGEVSDTKLAQKEFFERLREYGETHALYIKSWQKPRPQHWYDIRLGTSEGHIAVTVNSTKKFVGVELYLRDNKNLFARMQSQKDQIEAQLGFALDWQELPTKKVSRAIVTKSGDFQDESQIDELIAWVSATADSFAHVFPKYIAA